MSLIGNIIWIICGGLIASIAYAFGGLVLCLTIVGIPFGLRAFDLAGATLSPFGKRVISRPQGSGCLATVFNVFWLLFFGWEIALVHIVFGAILIVTIIGAPFGMQHFKLAQVALLPFSYTLE